MLRTACVIAPHAPPTAELRGTHLIEPLSGMHWVVLLRGVNVGGANKCKPAVIAKELTTFGLINVGAAGTFVVQEDVEEATLRSAIAQKLPFKCEIMICSARDLLRLQPERLFAQHTTGADITRFVSVAHEPLRNAPTVPLSFPSAGEWLLKLVAIQDRFIVGIYRRHMRAITYLGKFEKQLGVPVTTRNWNTIEKVLEIVRKDRAG